MSDVIFRHEDDNIALTGGLRPSYSNDQNDTFYSFPKNKPKYITTERYFPSVEKEYNLRGVKKTERDQLFYFWNEKLSYGENMFTVIDNRKRCLFNTLWDSFGRPEQWNANRNSHDINIKLQNPFGWTLPLHGLYPMVDSTKKTQDHLLGGINISQGAAYFINKTTDSNVLRGTGYALRLTGNDSATHQCGAQIYPSWKSKNGTGNISIFCQVKFEQLEDIWSPERFDVFNLSDGVNEIGITASGFLGTGIKLSGFIKNSIGIAKIHKSANNSYADLLVNTWYDLCLTFDTNQNTVAIYYCPSAFYSFTDFLSELTNIEDGILSTIEPMIGSISDYNLPDTTWTNVKLLYEYYENILTANKSAYLQNIFVIDSYTTAIEFNFLRRLCYYWNSKTTEQWPK